MGCYGPVLALEDLDPEARLLQEPFLPAAPRLLFVSLGFSHVRIGFLSLQTFTLWGEQVFAESGVALVKGSSLSALVNPGALVWIS